MGNDITCTTKCKHRIAVILYTLETWFRYIIVNTLYRGNNNNNNNNNINVAILQTSKIIPIINNSITSYKKHANFFTFLIYLPVNPVERVTYFPAVSLIFHRALTDLISTQISKDWSPLAYSHALSLFSFHLSETRLCPSIHRFSPTVSGEVRLSSSSTSLCFPTEYYVPHPLSITILLKDWILCEIATISPEMQYDGYKLHQLFENSV
jgi:hypothetical protein